MKKYLFGILAIVFVALLFIITVRVLTPEDTWICKDGKWQKHGSPSVEAPQKECR